MTDPQPLKFKTTPLKTMSRTQMYLLPQSVPCPHCGIGVSILELVHRGADNIVTCANGHDFPISQVAQYFGRIDGVGQSAQDVDRQVQDWIDRPAPLARPFPRFRVWPLVVVSLGGIVVGMLLGWLAILVIHGPLR